MSDKSLLGPWIRRFLLEHLVSERNLARNTQVSYRDTLALLVPFATSQIGKPVDRLTIEHITPEIVCAFLAHLEKARGCSILNSQPALGWNPRLGALYCYA